MPGFVSGSAERAIMTNPITQWNRMASANAVERQIAERADKAERTEGASPKAVAPAPPADDQVELSAVARQAPGETSFDRVKVDAIKQAIQNGQYPLDARRMAESFLALEQMIRE